MNPGLHMCFEYLPFKLKFLQDYDLRTLEGSLILKLGFLEKCVLRTFDFKAWPDLRIKFNEGLWFKDIRIEIFNVKIFDPRTWIFGRIFLRTFDLKAWILVHICKGHSKFKYESLFKYFWGFSTIKLKILKKYCWSTFDI